MAVTEFVISVFSVTLAYFLFNLIFKKETKQTESNEAIQYLKPIPRIPLWTLIFLGRNMTKWLRQIGKIANLVECQFGPIKFAVINDYQLGKELFRNPVFCGKETSEAFTLHSGGHYGVICTDGQQWKDVRRFCHLTLKDVGFGQRSAEAYIREDLDDLLKDWCDKGGKRFSPNKAFYFPVFNSIWVILAGKRATAKDKDIVELVNQVYTAFRNVFKYPDVIFALSQLSMANIRRIYKWIPIFSGLKGFVEAVEELHNYFRNIIHDRKELIKMNKIEHSVNLIDSFLKQIEKTTDPESPFYGTTGEAHLLGAMVDFFIAGGDTTATMLTWSMLHLIRNPEIQENIYKEIVTAVGTAKYPSLQDRPNCPLTEAFILETLRISPIASLSMPHTSTEDTNIGPYAIQKKTLLILNIYNINHDAKIWGDPEEFRPERFLSSDGKSIVKHEEMVAFSLGQRRCVGEQTAKDNLFLYVSAICQRFILKQDPLLNGKQQISESGSVVLMPDKFYMVAIDRLKYKNV